MPVEVSYPVVWGKSQSVREFVRGLAEHLGFQSFSVVDHWEADTHAIGIANVVDPRVLVYVSVNDSARRYFLSFESPPAGEWAKHPYTPGPERSVESLSEVMTLVREHVA
jgi:hypothetical protein